MDQLIDLFRNILLGLGALYGLATAGSILATSFKGKMASEERVKQESKHHLFGHAQELVLALGVLLFAIIMIGLITTTLSRF